MAASNSKLKSSSSFPNLLLSCLNLILFILSLLSLAPILLLKTPPTSLGYAFIISSLISILSSFIGLYPRLTHFCYMTHISFLLASLASQVLSFLALFTKEKTSLSLLDSPRDPREAKVLVRFESWVLMAIFLLQFMVLVLSCAIHKCWVREHQDIEMGRKRSTRIAGMTCDEEVMVDVAKISEVQAKELDEKVESNKYSAHQWVKNDFEGM